MKLILVIGLLTITATSIAVGQVKNTRAATSDKAEQEIRQVEDKRREALLRSNTTALDEIFADDYIVTNQFGQVQTKAQMISALKSGELKFESVVEDDVSVRVYGDAAVVTGRATSKHEGRESTQVRFTRVYVKRRGHWQAVTYQVTRIAQQ
jgi:ketosteroid isomerase-like protein